MATPRADFPTSPPETPPPSLDRLAAYDYALPPELIAQTPAPERDQSRLLVVDRAAGGLDHRRFRDLVDLLSPGDLLVVNATKVIPARLIGRKASGGLAEVFLSRSLGDRRWEALTRVSGRARPGLAVELDGGRAVLEEPLDGGLWTVRLESDDDEAALIRRAGRIPLPPYIGRDPQSESRREDIERYQTVYAREAGAVAAPTAGLHFTPALLDALKAKGVELAEVVLHVGLGTFQPLREDDLSQVELHEEWYRLPAETVRAIEAAKTSGRRVVGPVGRRHVDRRTLHQSARRSRILNQPVMPYRCGVAVVADAEVFASNIDADVGTHVAVGG